LITQAARSAPALEVRSIAIVNAQEFRPAGAFENRGNAERVLLIGAEGRGGGRGVDRRCAVRRRSADQARDREARRSLEARRDVAAELMPNAERTERLPHDAAGF